MKTYHSIARKLILFVFMVAQLIITEVPLLSQDQVTFTITSTPKYTPKIDTLYLGTSLNNWKNDPQYKFKYYPDGYYRLTINIGKAKIFEYKINRGDWSKAEANNWGAFLPNRRFIYSDSIYEVRLKVESWEDLHHSATIQVIVKSIPDYTPHDANIYIAGSFNNWMTDDSTHKLSKRTDGTYIGEIEAGFDSVSFKFTRGTWESAEGRRDGGMSSNRVYIVKQVSDNVIFAEVKSWNDLSSGMIWLKAIFLALFLQGIVLLSLLFRYYRTNLLLALSGILALVFFTKFFYADYKLFQLLPHMRFLPVIFYAFIGPWMYVWFKSIITKKPIRISYAHFLPLLPLLWFLQFIPIPAHDFYLKVVNNELMLFFFGSYAYAIALHLFFNYKLKLLFAKRIAEIPELTSQLFKSTQTNWYFSTIVFIISGICIWKNIEIKFIADWVDNLLWLGVGTMTVYYEWCIFVYIDNDFTKNVVKPGIEDLDQDRWISLKAKLTELMETKAVYANPRLMLSDVAKYIGTNSHYVSKLINEEFNKSFNDYINTLRIEAFIKSVQSDNSNNTFLFHAFKVGFNSKSAFNRSFKNYSNTTPREYFSKLK